jgi:hypothetical protein
MTWDKELEALARKALEVFGGEALADAYTRALSFAPEASLDQMPETVLDLIAATPGDIQTTKVVHGVDATVALKLELKRVADGALKSENLSHSKRGSARVPNSAAYGTRLVRLHRRYSRGRRHPHHRSRGVRDVPRQLAVPFGFAFTVHEI